MKDASSRVSKGFSTIDHIHTVSKLIEVHESTRCRSVSPSRLKKAFDSAETEAVVEPWTPGVPTQYIKVPEIQATATLVLKDKEIETILRAMAELLEGNFPLAAVMVLDRSRRGERELASSREKANLRRSPGDDLSMATANMICNCVMPRQEWRYNVAMGRNFQRVMGKKFGYDMGLEDRILLRSLGQRQRHLDQKKVTQLSTILGMKINEVASANEEVARLAVQFTKVKVNCSFTDVRVWWLCTGVNDEEIENTLNSQRYNLRKVLSDSIGVNCPELMFVPDRSELMLEEMDRLFRIADYGMDYRAVSHTGRILGNAETSKPGKWKPIPRKKSDAEIEKDKMTISVEECFLKSE
ncbi:hypothetical protein RB195_010649 [Necator americanus]|uniref:Uncharacterized protein n=1 Tax=Necator americanus TaxID=51031 RepID=A0ABR1CYW2_NECAM